MDLAGIDRTLAQLRPTVGVMSSNLLDLENDTTRTRLDQGPLSGTTAEHWSTARAALEGLWQWFAQLNGMLDQATQLRGTRSRLDADQVAKLDAVLNGPSIELSKADVPLAQRGLFGPAETTLRCSPPELLERMRAAFAQVTAVVQACAERWGTLDAKMATLDDQLVEARRLADAIGEQHRPELDQAGRQLDDLRQKVMTDPLACPDSAVAAVATALGPVVADLRRLVQLRDNLAGQLDEARALMAQLRSTTAEAAAAGAQAQAKIADPVVTDPQPIAADVATALDRIVATSTSGDWRTAASLLAGWTARGHSALADAQRALAINRAPMALRDELRGRLDAYRAKAYRLGRLEDAAVAALYAQAQNVLFTAPTDLAAAEQLVRRYQQAVGDAAPREVAT